MKPDRTNFCKLKYQLWVIVILMFTGCQRLTAQQIQQSGSKELRFALLTDLHVTPGNENEKHLQRIVADINLKRYDFVIATGDLTNTGSDAELEAAKRLLDQIKSPLLVIPGNHETNWSESAGRKFVDLWESDRIHYRINGYFIVGLNTGPFMKMGDGHVKEEDLQWLEETLKNQMQAGEKLIFFSHYPLNEGLDNWFKVTDILKAHDCLAAFCGHGHQLKLMNFDGIPGIMGRSTELRNRKDTGYNLVTLKNDSVIVYEKFPGKIVVSPFLALSLTSPDSLSTLPVSARPDYLINNLYPLVRKTYELTDTASVFTGACLVGDSLMVYGNSIGWIKALHIKKRTVLWQHRIQGPIYSTPVYSSGIVVVGTIDGSIKGFNIKTGREEWNVKTSRPVLAEGITEGSNVYIGGGDSAFYKLDIKNGKILWQYNGINGPIQGKPAISGRYVVFGAWDCHLYCLDKKSGKLVWLWNNGKSQVLFSPGNIVPVISQNKVFIVAPDRYITALDLKDGKQIWRTNKHMVRESMGISPDGKTIYAKLMYDSLLTFSPASQGFKALWTVDAGLGYDHNPCPVLGLKTMVVLANKNGLLVAVEPQTNKVLWKFKAGNSSINKIVYQSPGTLWITLTEGKITALDINHFINPKQ